MKLLIPNHIQDIFDLFKDHNYEVYMVGGCVRDSIMNRNVNDYDLCTSATPQEMIQIFKGIYPIIPTGLKHGTITLIANHEAIEITTYRIDQSYKDHRSPEQVSFTRSLLEDLKRRDFTINAIAYHPLHGMIDPMNGYQDIQDKIIRCVGDPEKRFEEDALRIIRGVRFAHVLNFEIEEQTRLALITQSKLLCFIAKERIRYELMKMLESDHLDLLIKLKDYHILEFIFPVLIPMIGFKQHNPWHIYDLFTHTQVALNHTTTYKIEMKLAVILHDIGKHSTISFDEDGIAHYKNHSQVSMELASIALKNLHFDRKRMNRILTLIEYHDYYLQTNVRVIKRFLNRLNYDYELAKDILYVQRADDLAKNPELIQPKLEIIDACLEIIEQMKKDQTCITQKQLRINGYDLLELGFQGKMIGEILTSLLDYVNEDPTRNLKENLIQYINQL